MRRFDCPNCGRSLWMRLLPFIGVRGGQFRFSCKYCGIALTYTGSQPFSDSARKPLSKAKLRALVIFLGGAALLSVIQTYWGRAIALCALGIVLLVLLAIVLFSPEPAYKIADRDNASDPGDSERS
jgi:hypothetical protein